MPEDHVFVALAKDQLKSDNERGIVEEIKQRLHRIQGINESIEYSKNEIKDHEVNIVKLTEKADKL